MQIQFLNVRHTGQTSAYKTIAAYLTKDQLVPFSLGPLFTTLCCIVWCVYVTLEVRDALYVMRATFYLKGPYTTTNASSGKMQITALSPLRIGFFLAVQTVRVCIAVALLIGGLNFLVGTHKMSDLLLNTMSLAFVRTDIVDVNPVAAAAAGCCCCWRCCCSTSQGMSTTHACQTLKMQSHRF